MPKPKTRNRMPLTAQSRGKSPINPAPVGKKDVNMRMPANIVGELDTLCDINGRSRQALLSILIHEAFLELKSNPQARIY